jgi:hypothetical protein
MCGRTDFPREEKLLNSLLWQKENGSMADPLGDLVMGGWESFHGIVLYSHKCILQRHLLREKGRRSRAEDFGEIYINMIILEREK